MKAKVRMGMFDTQSRQKVKSGLFYLNYIGFYPDKALGIRRAYEPYRAQLATLNLCEDSNVKANSCAE